MEKNNKIALNFLPIEPNRFEFSVYRKLKIGNEKRPNKEIWGFSLPKTAESEGWSKYWISFCPREEYTDYLCSADKNIYLTEEYLFQNVLDNLQNSYSEKIAKIGDRFNKRRIYITVAEFKLGKQTVFIEPYFLKISGEFGFLIDFHFLSKASSNQDIEVFLYKLHGSIDWERNQLTGQVTYKNMNKINKPDLIFGNIYKLQYVDPYLFQFYELRKYTLDSKLIIVVGYSFGDEHINGILSQALKHNIEMKLLFVSPGAEKNYVKTRLGLKNKSQIEISEKRANEFFANELKLIKISELFLETDKDDLWG